MRWPDGSDHVRHLNKLRCIKETGGVPLGIVFKGSWNRGVETLVSIRLFGRTSALYVPPKSKNVCQPIKRLGALANPRKSTGSGLPCSSGSKIKPKNGCPSSP